MESKIDLHIIKSDRPYFDECIKSVEDSNAPINLHIVKHREGYFGEARIDGWSQGTSEYVACLDDDDILLPGTMERALDAMNKGYSAYYSNHYTMNVDGNITGKWFEKLKPSRGFTQQVQMHHIVVYRRSVIEPLMHYLEGVKCREKKLFNLASIYAGKVYGDDWMGMKWRRHEDGNHKKRSPKDNPDRWNKKIREYQILIQKNK